jgi:hypothetical protein
MNDTRRTRRMFQPQVDSLEGRVVLSSGVAGAVHAHAVQVQEQRHLRHEHKIELQKERQLLRKELRAERRAAVVRMMASAAASNPGAMSITVGTPSPARTVASGASGTTSTGGLKIHSLAANNLDAGAAFRGLPVGIATVGTVVSTGRSGGGGSGTTSSGVNSNLTNVTGTTGTSTSNTSSNTGIVPIITIPTTPGSSVTNTSGGTTPGAGSVTFINLTPASPAGSTTANSSGVNSTSTGTTPSAITTPSTLNGIVTNALTNSGLTSSVGTSVANAILNAATNMASGSTR